MSIKGHKTLPVKSNKTFSLPLLGPPSSNGLLRSRTLIRNKILKLLERFPTVKGPLDITDILLQIETERTEEEKAKEKEKGEGENDLHLSEDNLSDFISHYPQCEILLMRSWRTIFPSFLRTVSLTLGPKLLELNLSHSAVSPSHFEILFSNMYTLQSLTLSHCTSLLPSSFRILSATCGKTLKHLYINSANIIKHESILYISGGIGFQAPRLSKLSVLDVSSCPLVEDRSLVKLASCCHRLKEVNLSSNVQLSDEGICALLANNSHLQLLNVASCVLLTDRVLVCLSSSNPRLLSLNLSLNYLMTDAGIVSLSTHCAALQALNLSGLRYLTEISLSSLAENCKGLLMLNVTGCSNITLSGIRALTQGLPFIEEAFSFVGIKPIDVHMELKLASQLLMNRSSAACTIQRKILSRTKKKNWAIKNKIEMMNNAARILQRSLRFYSARMDYFRLWRKRVAHER